MPKKVITIMLILCLSLVTLAGCGKATSTASSSSDNSLDKVKKVGEMVIGIDNTYPPMEFKDKTTGNNKGFDIDVANAVGKKLGVKVKFVPNAWDGIFLALKSKKFDLIQSSVSVTDERKKTMIFTEPYIYGGNAIFVKSDNTTVKSDKDFPDKILGCQAGTTAQESLSKLSGIKEVKKYEAMTDAFLDLENGRTAAVVCDPMVGDYYNVTNPGKFKKLKSSLTKEPIAVAFRKEDKSLKDAYNKALNELKKDGTLSNLSKKWFGLDIYADEK